MLSLKVVNDQHQKRAPWGQASPKHIPGEYPEFSNQLLWVVMVPITLLSFKLQTRLQFCFGWLFRGSFFSLLRFISLRMAANPFPTREYFPSRWGSAKELHPITSINGNQVSSLLNGPAISCAGAGAAVWLRSLTGVPVLEGSWVCAVPELGGSRVWSLCPGSREGKSAGLGKVKNCSYDWNCMSI